MLSDNKDFRNQILKGITDYDKSHDEKVNMYESTKIHALGDYPLNVIDSQRPNEPDEIKQYRYDSYIPRTKNVVDKFFTFITKIYKGLKLEEKNTSITQALKNEHPFEYITQNYPFYDSFIAYLRDYYQRQKQIDPNSFVVVKPINLQKEQNDFYLPFAYIVNSNQVLYHQEDVILIYLSNEKSKYTSGDKVKYDGKIIVEVEQGKITEWIQIGDQEGEAIFEGVEYEYTFVDPNTVPFFMVSNFTLETQEENSGIDKLQESLLSRMTESLDKAARHDSDLEAQYTLHCYPEKWQITTDESVFCNRQNKGIERRCKDCDGGCKDVASPFGTLKINPNNTRVGDNTNIPTPPAGYIDKDISTIDKLEKKVSQDLYNALDSINLDYLAIPKTEQSGIAKAYDREEILSVLMTEASQVFKDANMIIYLTYLWRYSNILSLDKIKSEVLTYKHSNNFDTMTSQIAMQRYLDMKDSNSDANLVNNARLEAIKLEYGEDSEVYKVENLVSKIDPFPGKTIDEILALNASGLALEDDAKLSIYGRNLIKELLTEDSEFLSKDYKEQKEKILDKVQEKRVVTPERTELFEEDE